MIVILVNMFLYSRNESRNRFLLVEKAGNKIASESGVLFSDYYWIMRNSLSPGSHACRPLFGDPFNRMKLARKGLADR